MKSFPEKPFLLASLLASLAMPSAWADTESAGPKPRHSEAQPIATLNQDRPLPVAASRPYPAPRLPAKPLPDDAPWDNEHPWDNDSHSPFRISFMPLLGNVGGFAGAAFDFAIGYDFLAVGFRQAGGTEFCMFCVESEDETQRSILIGVRQEFAMGILSFKSGLTEVERTRRGKLLYEGHGLLGGTTYEMRTTRDITMPLQFDLVLGGRFVGVDLSMTILRDKHGGSTSVLVGLPFGLLRI